MAKAGWGGFGRSGLSSGKCEIRDKGVSWRSGGWATPQTEISGTFHLAWSVVDAAQAYPLPGKIRGLGGGVTFKLSHDKGTVEGQFLGSVSGMSKALELSRLSSADPLGAGSEWHGQAQEGAKYFVLSGDDGKPIMLARVGWPGVHECITPAVRIGLHTGSLIEAQVNNPHDACFSGRGRQDRQGMGGRAVILDRPMTAANAG